MSNSDTTPDRDAKQEHQERKREERQHEKAVEDTFPASDPPATSQPGSGITGPEVIEDDEKKHGA